MLALVSRPACRSPFQPGGGEVFGTSGFGLRDLPTPWPRGGSQDGPGRCCRAQAPADYPISLMVDASGTHVDAVLQHFCCLSWAPLSFFSKMLLSAETRYSAFDRKLLAVYSTICHFHLMLEGRQVFVLTHHKPLCHSLGRLSAPWSAPQQQHLAYISELTQDI